MSNRIFLTSVLCMLAATGMAQTTIIGGTTGNGNFNAGITTGPNGGDESLTYDLTANWHWATGLDSSQNFAFDSVMGGSSDPHSGGGYVYQGRLVVNDTGYTIASAGEVFSLDYEFGAGGAEGNYGNDEFLRAYLFTATASVDALLTTGNMSQLSGNDDYFMNRNGGVQWTSHSQPTLYTSVAGDVGKTVYLAVQFNNPTDPGGDPNPRIENVVLEVAAGTPPPPPPPAATNITILANSTGNADFEDGEPAASGAVTYANTIHWFNAQNTGSDENINFTQDSQTAGSSQPNSRAGMPFQNRLQVNDTGHTVTTTGEVFNLSYDFGRTGGNWDNDEQMRTFLFTASAAVDGSLGNANMTEYGSVLYTFPASPSWTTFSTNGFYTSTAADIGKTFYFGMEHKNPGGGDVYPRIDVINLNVDIGGTGSTNEPPVVEEGSTAWDDFVTQYGLSGYYQTDADNDGVSDRVEFAHGGNPTNPADTGTMPSLVYSNSTASLISLESSSTNPGITYVAEWTDNLTNENWQTAFVSTNSTVASSNYNEVVYNLNGAGQDEAFFRNRIAPSDSRPNILLIMADDLGYADVSFNHPYSGPNENNAYNGSTQISTPELDSLANSGTIFTSAYVVHPFCGPSRMGLMAGRYPHEFGGPYNLPDDSSTHYTDQGISTNETLLSTMLQDAGYYTGMMGKWHLGQVTEFFHPNNRGFDDFYGFLGGGIIYWGPYQAGGWDYGRYPEHNQTTITTLGVNDHITDVLTEQGSNFIVTASSTEDPFFLFMSYNAPHSVLVSGGRDQAKPEDLAFYAGVPDRMRRNYLGLVRHMDRCVGDLVQTLKDTGQYDNTLIIFLSDNGGRYDSVGGWGDNGVLRGRKGDVTEGGFRVPMFMHWPGMIPSGVTYDHPVTALDFYPTFARLAETTIPGTKDIDGKDIWDTLLHASDSRPGEPIYTVTHHTPTSGSFSKVGIRQDNWKAVKLSKNGNWELYNITNDVSEAVDVSGANYTILSNLVTQGEIWSGDHTQPLWWNDPTSAGRWNSDNMPNYNSTFSLP